MSRANIIRPDAGRLQQGENVAHVRLSKGMRFRLRTDIRTGQTPRRHRLSTVGQRETNSTEIDWLGSEHRIGVFLFLVTKLIDFDRSKQDCSDSAEVKITAESKLWADCRGLNECKEGKSASLFALVSKLIDRFVCRERGIFRPTSLCIPLIVKGHPGKRGHQRKVHCCEMILVVSLASL